MICRPSTDRVRAVSPFESGMSASKRSSSTSSCTAILAMQGGGPNEPGDRLQFQGPGGSYRPSPEADWHLLVGDESAFGAIGASLQSLPSTAQAVVFALVERPGYEIEFPSSAQVTVNWLYREGASNVETVLVDAVRRALFPGGEFDVFVHGEAAEVRALRQHLVDDRRVDPDNASISAYWRRNHTDEDWRKIKREFMASHAA